jgi:hypothetical protein
MTTTDRRERVIELITPPPPKASLDMAIDRILYLEDQVMALNEENARLRRERQKDIDNYLTKQADRLRIDRVIEVLHPSDFSGTVRNIVRVVGTDAGVVVYVR